MFMYVHKPHPGTKFHKIIDVLKGQAVITTSLNDISANLTHNVSTIREVSIDAW